MDEQNKNMILAVALSFLVILVWTVFFAPEPPAPNDVLADGTTQGSADGLAASPPLSGDGTGAGTPTLDGGGVQSREATLAETQRVTIENEHVIGSLSLLGGRIDDLKLRGYREELPEDSPLVTLLSPFGSPDAYYALYGWAPAGDLGFDAVPGAKTPWAIESGSNLDANNAITLKWDNGAGLIFRREVSLDDRYMFTIKQSVENTTGAAVRMLPYGIIARHGEPELENFFISHEGIVRSTDGELGDMDYDDVRDLEVDPNERAGVDKADILENGWVGFADKYWLTSLIPSNGAGFTSVVKYVAASDTYQTDMRGPVMDIAPGAKIEVTSDLFAGAKEWETLRSYQNDRGIPQFLDAIDWGWFYFFTKPLYWLLHTLNVMIGNMGWAIIALTLVIKAILFPLAYKSYVSMARMKELQPEMEKVKERVGDDRQKMQQEMMALYKKEKVNPASGCLPILVQIPIFFSLYKVIFVTLEIRHAPFIGWIQDLSMPDPTSWMNLFGALPYDIPAFLGILSIGVWPILMGVTMWMQQKLNPAPTDPTQAMIFNWLPWIFMFMLGSFASGLVIYWVANNTITFIQQYTIMRSQGVKPDVFGNIISTFKKSRDDGPANSDAAPKAVEKPTKSKPKKK